MIVIIQHGQYVAGFNSQHQIVQRTSVLDMAKTFASTAAAEKWLAKYVNAGYGLTNDAKVVTL